MRKTNRVSPVIPTVHEGWEATARSTVDGEPGLSSSVGENLPVNLEEETTISTAHNCDTLTSECVSRQTDVRPNESFHPRISESEQEAAETDGAEVFDQPDRESRCLALLHYFLTLPESEEEIDFAHIHNLIDQGADVLATNESTGCSIMHEVAENWDITVAQFLYERGADVQCSDANGKTPLHIAASIDHKDMIVWLIKHGADLEARTSIEKQTPLHHATRSDSMLSLQTLIEHGGNYEVRDYKGRTPLHLAAELDRTVVAEYLLSLDQPAKCTVYDDQGNHVITTMIRTMPQVAVESLKQFHKLAPAERKQFYMLDNLECKPGDQAMKGIKSPFEMAVEEGRYDFLTHQVMEQLITQKWKHSVRWYYYFYLGAYVLFLLSWSILISYPSVQLKHLYIFPTDIWRILVELIAVVTYVHQIVDEALEIYRSKLKHKQFTDARIKSLKDDLANTDISLPEERKYLMSEMTRVKKSPPNYFKDPWNILDIVTYFVLLVVILMHVIDIAVHTTEIAIWTARISCLAALFIWVRLLKLARALRALGPLIAIIGELIADILRYFALYSVFFIPFLISAWVVFGGDQSAAMANNEDLTFFHRVAIMLFRISLIDSFPYQAMRTIDELMAAIIVLTFLIFTAVIGLNLFIALLSDTFQRVYDNAQANALLQQARIILSFEDKVSRCTYTKYLVHIQNNCSPLVCFYDDDEDKGERPGQLQKITHQIYTIVSELQKDRKDEDETAASAGTLQDKLEQQDLQLSRLNHQLADVRSLLLSMQQGNTAVRSTPTLDDVVIHDPCLPHGTAYNMYTQHGQSCRLPRQQELNKIRIDRPQTDHVAKLTPISVQPNVSEDHLTPTQVSYTTTLEHPSRQQDALPRSRISSHSSPILVLPSISNSPGHDQQSSSQIRSFSVPRMVGNYSASDIRFGSVVAKTHRRFRKKK